MKKNYYLMAIPSIVGVWLIGNSKNILPLIILMFISYSIAWSLKSKKKSLDASIYFFLLFPLFFMTIWKVSEFLVVIYSIPVWNIISTIAILVLIGYIASFKMRASKKT